MRAIWETLTDFGVTSDDLGHIDLYSCFPRSSRVPATSSTSTRSIRVVFPQLPAGSRSAVVPATTTSRTPLRHGRPTPQRLVESRSRHRARLVLHQALVGRILLISPRDGFRWAGPQEQIDRQARCASDQRDGPATVESYTVTHSSNGEPERLIIAARTPDDVRTWCHSTEATLMEESERTELIGRAGEVRSDVFAL